MIRLAAVATVLLVLAACSDGADFETYTDETGGGVWIVSDCPNTDQLLSGDPDGLPPVEAIQTREEIEGWLGTGQNHSIVPRNGEAWSRAADGSIETHQVNDYLIIVTLDDVTQCPGSGAFINNGVPVIYRIGGD